MLQGHFCSTVLKAHLYFLAPRSTLYFLRRVSMLLICPHRDEYIPGGDCSTSAQKSPDMPGSPEGNTEGPGTASSEPLLPS